jgi:transposase
VAYFERVLAPSLRAGQVVVMDNLSAHKGERVRELIEERGAKLLYLPAYSPNLNPIEEALAKVKALLRRASARSREALLKTGAALDADNTRAGAASERLSHCDSIAALDSRSRPARHAKT